MKNKVKKKHENKKTYFFAGEHVEQTVARQEDKLILRGDTARQHLRHRRDERLGRVGHPFRFHRPRRLPGNGNDGIGIGPSRRRLRHRRQRGCRGGGGRSGRSRQRRRHDFPAAEGGPPAHRHQVSVCRRLFNVAFFFYLGIVPIIVDPV